MTQAQWLSAHMYFRGDLFDGSCDDVLRSVVWPLVADLRASRMVGSSFFVRYADPERHIRLRLLVESNSASGVVRTVEKAWKSPNTAGSPASHRAHLKWIPYDPEIMRYGGPAAMPIVERLFDASSTLAEELLTPSVSEDRGPRLGRAVFATLVFLYRFLGDRARLVAFAQEHAPLYLRGHLLGPDGQHRAALERAALEGANAQREQIARIVDALETGEDLPDPFVTFARAVSETKAGLTGLFDAGQLQLRGQTEVADWAVASDTLSQSLVHMTYNRLGITRFEEALLSLVLRHTVNA